MCRKQNGKSRLQVLPRKTLFFTIQGKNAKQLPQLNCAGKTQHLHSPEDTKKLQVPTLLGIQKPAIFLSKYYGKSSNSSFSMGRKFGAPRACFPFHGTSLRCVFNSYRDDGHRFIAARWEISQCQVTAAFIVENKVPRLRKSTNLHRWELCIMQNFCYVKNNPLRCNGRGSWQKQSAASYITTLYEVMSDGTC
ncbi:hypothetical protein T05_4001 [Trichinella murrelli]|uniref:Uncharacterized protein n=1 Tax=Trichinella murrelli TaxID=144512 RepID=A0A0V0TES2_9BILA|nr:hypothetical protein T05_4001 [Trichinella murrelli]